MKLAEGKVAIITGAGRGIGRAVAELLARHGARVVVNDLKEDVAEEAAGAIRAAGGEVVGRRGLGHRREVSRSLGEGDRRSLRNRSTSW